MKRLILLFALVPGSVALAQEAKPPTEVSAKAPPAPKVGSEVELSLSSLGAYDSNVKDKDQAVSAGGFDLGIQLKLGVPLGQRVGWGSSAGFGTKYRNGGVTEPSATTLKLEGSAATGFEALLAGDGSIPGRKVKGTVFPLVKLGLEGRYKLSTSPVITKPVEGFDDIEDSLEVSEDSDEDGGDEDEEEGASTGGGGQTFSSPNTHHNLGGTLKLAVEPLKRFSVHLEGGLHHDFVALGEGVMVSPEFTEVAASTTFKLRIVPEILHAALGYSFDHRWYDEETTKAGDPLLFMVHGIKAGLELPLKRVKLKASYDLKLRVVDVDTAMNRTRHEVQLGAEVPVLEKLSALVDTRLSATEGSGPTALRFIAMAGLKYKL